MKIRHIGLLVGAAVGIVWGWLGFKDLMIAVLCAFVGWLVVGMLEGEVDLRGLLESLRRK